jgi:serine/threonine protein phosphatase PrpC
VITIAAWTHVGLVRARNEDAIALPGTIVRGSPPSPVAVRSAVPKDGSGNYILAVIDGMGGHAGGAEASLIAALRLSDTRDDIEQALAAVNAAMYDEMDRTPALRGMGATVAGVEIRAEAIEVFNVGDARAYTHADGVWKRRDHPIPGWHRRTHHAGCPSAGDRGRESTPSAALQRWLE